MPAVKTLAPTVTLIEPAAVILTGTAKVGTPFKTASTESEASAVAARIDVALEPAVVPTDKVEVVPTTAVVELIVAATIMALSGITAVEAGMIAPTAPPSTAKLYLALAVRSTPKPVSLGATISAEDTEPAPLSAFQVGTASVPSLVYFTPFERSVILQPTAKVAAVVGGVPALIVPSKICPNVLVTVYKMVVPAKE